jgi:uncharacterized membrane protein YqiK
MNDPFGVYEVSKKQRVARYLANISQQSSRAAAKEFSDEAVEASALIGRNATKTARNIAGIGVVGATGASAGATYANKKVKGYKKGSLKRMIPKEKK